MQSSLKTLASSSVLACALAAFSASPSQANILDINPLGTGSDLRALQLEAACGAKDTSKSGDHKCGAADSTKAKEHKCGEGKCGDSKKADMKKADTKSDAKAGAKAAKKDEKAAKTKEAKCGEGKCGN